MKYKLPYSTRLKIVEALQDFCAERGVENTTEIYLYEIEDIVSATLIEVDGLDTEFAHEVAEHITPQFDDLDCEKR